MRRKHPHRIASFAGNGMIFKRSGRKIWFSGGFLIFFLILKKIHILHKYAIIAMLIFNEKSYKLLSRQSYERFFAKSKPINHYYCASLGFHYNTE